MNAITLLMASALTAQPFDRPFGEAAQPPPTLDKNVELLAADNNRFAVDLYHQLAQGDKNLFFSPFSISSALAMTYGGVRGDTAAEMKNALHFRLPADRFHRSFGLLMRDINGGEFKRGYKLVTANRLWGQKDYGFLADFQRLTGTNYRAGLEEVDFKGDTEGARRIINAWVEKQTQDKIKDLLKPGVLDPDSRLVLTNAIYFKSGWTDEFNVRATKKKEFHGSKGAALVHMMHKTNDMSLYQDDRLQLVNLTYDSGDLSMMILLPRAKDGLPALEKALSFRDMQTYLAKMSRFNVNLSMPKFKMTAEESLKEPLKNLGMKLAFTDFANFSGMTTRDSLKITAVVHKAFVDVNEQGTEAAAATAVIVGLTGAPAENPRAEFVADHPFVFWIQDNRTGSILFMGRVMDVN